MVRPLVPMIERFVTKFEPEPMTGCWLWLGAVMSTGRPVIRGPGREAGIWLASRVSYELFVGPIPPGLFVCHTCDTPMCVNPAHLWVGTNADNIRDMWRKGRGVHAGFMLSRD